MAKVEIISDYCKACKLCILACKKGALRIGKKTNAMGYNSVEMDPEKECIGCKMCTATCPEAAIEIYK